MTNLLQIDTSTRTARSISRLLAKEFVDRWIANNPNNVVTYRDIGQFPIPHVTEAWMDAADSSGNELTIDTLSELFLSNELVDELLVNDRYLIATPILKFTIPSTLQTYIDLIIRNGLTVGNNEHCHSYIIFNKSINDRWV